MNNSDSGVLIWHGAEIAYNFIAYNDWFGIGLNSSGSLIHHNNIIGNLIQAYEDSVIANEWDNGYPDGGNYWSDYAGPDIMNGPDQDMLGSDGIGDTPRVVPMGREDKYPLMEPFEVNRPPVARFEVTPPVGDTSTVFEFNASSSWDYETSAGDLMFRWDWDGDGAWDTGWSSESTLTHQFATPGNYSVKLEVRDAGNTTGDFSLQVEVVEQIPELPTLFLPVMVTMLCLLILTYSSFARRRHRRGSD
jgi:PKD repeat protein